MMHVPADDRSAQSGVGAANVARHWRLRVDISERHAALLDLARRCGDFEICMERLAVGDYLIDDGIVIERKTYADFATSLVDGRLFPQAAALARSPHRPIVLLEGPTPAQMPDVHAHALKGAMLSLAVMWRLPVICSRNPEDSLRILRLLAGQLARTNPEVLQRYDRKPKRLESRRLYMLRDCRAFRYWRIASWSISDLSSVSSQPTRACWRRFAVLGRRRRNESET
jgi:ERCC4-type nuclease